MMVCFFFSSRRRHTRWTGDWSSDVCSSDLMASLLVLLGAVDRGLAGCFFGVPQTHWDALQKAFAVPPRLTPVGAISLGYRAPDRRSPSLRRGRRPLGDVVTYGSFR